MPNNRHPAHRRPSPQGLYHPVSEHDACGVGMICQLDNAKSHALVHLRYRTNPFPSWKPAQPFRYLYFNDEINTGILIVMPKEYTSALKRLRKETIDG